MADKREEVKRFGNCGSRRFAVTCDQHGVYRLRLASVDVLGTSYLDRDIDASVSVIPGDLWQAVLDLVCKNENDEQP